MAGRKLSVRDLDVDGRRVFVRVDFNVPLADGRVADDTRVRASLPTLRSILERGGRPVVASHLGRPKGRPDPGLSLRPVAACLEPLAGVPVTLAPGCVGPEAEQASRALRPGEILLLENLRFHKEEEANQDDFARRLALLADLYVNDAFGSAHRAHASVVGITRHLPRAAAGLLMEAEIAALERLRDRPDKPYVAVLGGAKVSDKMELIRRLLARVDALVIGGAMAYTFLKAQGVGVGGSRVEEDRIDQARELLARAASSGVRVHLPVDHVVAPSPRSGENHWTTPDAAIPDGLIGLDIGPRSRDLFAGSLSRARTIFWNGPLGLCEVPPFDEGTGALARAIAAAGAFSVVGGGDSIAAINRLGLASSFSHLSTGGGASLEFLSGVDLPGLGALADAPLETSGDAAPAGARPQASPRDAAGPTRERR